MRVALLAMIEPAGEDGETPRAFLSVAGRSVVQHQLELALALDCRRVIVLARGDSEELAALRERAEQAAAVFHAITDAQGLLGLVSAGDELLTFADGLLVEPAAAARLLEPGQAVLVQPIEAGLLAGFERLDINRATGGIMLAPARLVNRLAELPADYDPVSALTRIALQAGVPMREIPDASRERGGWTLVRSEAEAQRLDGQWIALNLGDDRDATATQLLARATIRRFGSSMLHAGSGSRMLTFGTALLLLMALVAGWLGAVATGLVFVALSVFVGHTALLLLRVEQGALRPLGAPAALTVTLALLTDAALVLLVGSFSPRAASMTVFGRTFAPLVMVAALRLVPRLYGRSSARWLHDRAAVALVLAAATVLGVLVPAVELIGLGLLAGSLAQQAIGARRRRPEEEPPADAL